MDCKDVFVPRKIRFQIYSNGINVRSYKSLLVNFSVKDVITVINNGSLSIWLNNMGKKEKAETLTKEFAATNQLCAYEENDYKRVIKFFFGNEDVRRLWQSKDEYKKNLSLYEQDRQLIEDQKYIHKTLQVVLTKKKKGEPCNLDKVSEDFRNKEILRKQYPECSQLYEFASICCDLCLQQDNKSQKQKLKEYKERASEELKDYISLALCILYESEKQWRLAKELYASLKRKFLFAKIREGLIKLNDNDINEKNLNNSDLNRQTLRNRKIDLSSKMSSYRLLILAQNFLFLK